MTCPTRPEIDSRDLWVREHLNAVSSPMAFGYGDGAFDTSHGWASASSPPSAGNPARISHKHLATGLRAEAEFDVFDDFAALEWVPRLTADGDSTTSLVQDWQSLATEFTVSTGTPTIHYSGGALATIDDFAPKHIDLEVGEEIRFSPGDGRSSNGILPFFNIDLHNAGVILGIGWTGEWAVRFARPDKARLLVEMGLERTRFVLHPGESVRGPMALLLFWDGELRRAQNQLRRLILAHHTRSHEGHPSGPGLSAATWGATPTKVHTEVIRQIADRKLPFERYWVDAGWYGTDGQWWENVGTWQPNDDIHPGTLRPISEAVHAAGMQFALWFEPERATKDSQWHREHPEWMLHVAPEQSRQMAFGRPDALFNLADRNARNFLIDFVSDRITEWGIDIYRQDFNFPPLDFWRSSDAPDRAGVSEMLYVEGLYGFWDGLLQRHAGLVIDNCASGGRRIDLETLSRSTPLSRSDYLTDPVGHQCHTYGLSSWVPVHATLPHTGYDAYSLRSGAGAGLSLSWATNFNQPESGPFPEDFDFSGLRILLHEHLSTRDYFLADFYPLSPYSTAYDTWLAYQFDRPESGDGLAYVFRRRDCPQKEFHIALHGLDPGATYSISDGFRAWDAKGADLTGGGLNVTLAARPDSIIFRYRRHGMEPDR